MDTISILKSILGGNATGSKRVEEIQKRPSSSGQPGGGLSDILGSVLGGSIDPNNPGGLGSQLEDLLGVGRSGPASPQQSSPSRPPQHRQQPFPRPSAQPSRRQRQQEPENDEAISLIRAMCNAAKVDGEIDRNEQDAILGRLGDNIGQAELDFVRRELNSPLNLDDYCDSVPQHLAPQVYAFSLLAIKLDTLTEAAYLGRLAAGLELDNKTCNEIHKQIGAPCLYA